jgi:hypothetical protein
MKFREIYMQTLKKLQQQIRSVWPSRKMDQALLIPTGPIYHPPSSIFMAPESRSPRMPFANDEELKHSARKAVEKQSQLFEDEPMTYVYFIISAITLSEKKIGGIIVPPPPPLPFILFNVAFNSLLT